MLKENDRVKFIDNERDKQFGILIIFKITGDIATCGSGDYTNLGQNMCNARLSELKLAE